MSRNIDAEPKLSDVTEAGLGEKMKKWRERMGWEQSDLAARIGVKSRQTIGYQENKEDADTQVRMLVELCNASEEARAELLGHIGLHVEDDYPAALGGIIRRLERLGADQVENVIRAFDASLMVAEGGMSASPAGGAGPGNREERAATGP